MTEHQHTEWKESWRDEYLKWIAGFANAQGGVLVIGKNDAGKIVGVADAKRLLVDLPNKVRDVLGIVAEVNLHTHHIDGVALDTLDIVVEPYPHPVSYKGEYHVRSGSTKQELKGAALDRFLLARLGRHWDAVPVPYVAPDDLDPQAFKTFRQLAARSGRLDAASLAEADVSLIEKLHLREGQYLKRAATLLFHADPQKFTTGAYVKIGFFRTNVDLLYHDVIEGTLFNQIDRTLDLLLTKYLRAGLSYQGSQRHERLPVPEPALREALINAIAHKDYGSGIPIQISVYDDKLMIWNPGQLPADWSLDRLLAKHASQPANPDVANALFLTGKIESWGRGIELIRGTCAAANGPAPNFQCDSAGFWIEFSFAAVEEPPKTTVTPVETPVEIVVTPVETPVEILQCLQARPEMTLAEVALTIGKSLRAVERASAKLVEAGRMKYVGPKKGGHWEVLK
jgi:ATP-dependent DNA helicase RecG